MQTIEKRSVAGMPLSEFLVKLGYFLSLVIIIPLLFPSGRSFKYTDLTVGSIATKKVIAPFRFPILKMPEELAVEQQKAKQDVPFFFQHNDTLAQIQILSLRELFRYLEQLPEELKVNKELTANTDSLLVTLLAERDKEIINRFQLDLRSNEINQLVQLVKLDKDKRMRNQLVNILRKLYSEKIINITKSSVLNKKVTMIQNGIEEDLDFEQVRDFSQIPELLTSQLKNTENSEFLKNLLLNFCEPNIYYDKQLSEERQREAIKAVPTSKDFVYENERIVDENERITADIYQKLYSLEVATAESSTEKSDIRQILSVIAKYLLTALILFLFVLYLSTNRQKIFADNRKLLLLTILIFLQMALGAIIVNTLDWSAFLIPTTLSSMLIGILLDPGVGFVGTVIIALLLGGITGFDYFFMFLTLFVGIIAIYSVTHIRTRNQIFKAILYIIIAYFGVNFTFGILRFEEFKEIFQVFSYYMLPNAILAPFITYMTLGLFERTFDITTDITLLELSDLNHPLLKELAVKAPGTFHHSIILGNLAEAAAKAVSGNPLLARVGSYYHDIGKMVKPEYFVENEKGSESKHNSLAPNMSALILASHVKSGLEMAEEYNLPKIIRDFIPEHHGKNLMSFFYDKALKSKEINEVNEMDYRYPGPSPQSKETAIVMLADTVEAASKTLSNPTPSRMRKLVEDLVEKRFLEGELDDSELTMQDLKRITDAFLSVLSGIYHKRVEYPSSDSNKKLSKKGTLKKESDFKVLNNGSTAT